MRDVALVAAWVMLLGALAHGQASAQTAKAELRNAKGEMVGTLTLAQEPDGVRTTMEASNLPPGFHGFHVHAVGKCEAPFTSAGGHFNPGGQNHAHHAGDLPNIHVPAGGALHVEVLAADVTLDAVFPSAETRFIFPELLEEGLEPHHVREVWLFGSERADTFVDIAGVLDVKIRALREHRSQLGEWDPSPMLAGWARQQGAKPRLKAAEAFRRMVLED